MVTGILSGDTTAIFTPVYMGDGMLLAVGMEYGMAYLDSICLTVCSLVMQDVIAQFLQERRKAAGKTQVQVAAEALEDAGRKNCSSVLERGDALPDIPTLLKLGKALNFSLSDIEYAVSSYYLDQARQSAFQEAQFV